MPPVAGRSLCRSHELREGVYVALRVFAALRILAGRGRAWAWVAVYTCVVRNRIKVIDRTSQACVLRKEQTIGDAYLVKICVAGEGEKTCVLVFVAEATDAARDLALGVGFLDGHVDGLALNEMTAHLVVRLAGGYREQRRAQIFRLSE